MCQVRFRESVMKSTVQEGLEQRNFFNISGG